MTFGGEREFVVAWEVEVLEWESAGKGGIAACWAESC